MKIILIFLLFIIILGIFIIHPNSKVNYNMFVIKPQTQQNNLITPLAGPTLKSW